MSDLATCKECGLFAGERLPGAHRCYGCEAIRPTSTSVTQAKHDAANVTVSHKSVRGEGDPHAFCVTPGMLTETQRLLDLREQQLADCTRAMREVSAVLRSWGSGETWCCLADRLDAARAGKAGA